MRKLLLALGIVTIGCGSTSERMPDPITTAPTADAGTDGAPVMPPVPPKRTMKQSPLLGTIAPENLLIDPTFGSGEFGIGRWLTSFSGVLDLNGPPLGQIMLSDSPSGIALVVGTLYDVPEKEAPRTMTLLAQVIGGTGPYVVRLWIATDDLPGETSWFPLVRVTLAAAVSSGLSGNDIKPDETTTRRIGGRSWTQFVGETAGPYSLGAWLSLRFKASKHRWYIQAPEVLPKALATGMPTRSAILHPLLARVLDSDEALAIDRYRREPLRYGPLPR